MRAKTAIKAEFLRLKHSKFLWCRSKSLDFAAVLGRNRIAIAYAGLKNVLFLSAFFLAEWLHHLRYKNQLEMNPILFASGVLFQLFYTINNFTFDKKVVALKLYS